MKERRLGKDRKKMREKANLKRKIILVNNSAHKLLPCFLSLKSWTLFPQQNYHAADIS